MSLRSSTSLLGLCLATAAAALLSPAAAQQWVMPRTPDGHPDLQGNWTNGTITPFQRAEGKGPVFTWDEVAELEQRAGDRVVRGAQARRIGILKTLSECGTLLERGETLPLQG